MRDDASTCHDDEAMRVTSMRKRSRGPAASRWRRRCYAAFILAAWRIDFIMKPFKLLAVFVHEANHALACILTGGHVDGLEVNMNEGGVTKYFFAARLCRRRAAATPRPRPG